MKMVGRSRPGPGLCWSAVACALASAIGAAGSPVRAQTPGSTSAPQSAARASAPGPDNCPKAVIAHPQWLKIPYARDLSLLYPERALRLGEGDHVAMNCTLTNDGTLTDCSVVRDDNPGQGFAAATLTLAPYFKSAPPSAYPEVAKLPACAKTSGATVTVAISWGTEGSDSGPQGIMLGSQHKATNEAAIIGSHPSTVAGHMARGKVLLDVGRYAEALAAFDAAIALDAKSQMAWADRAIAHAWLRDPAAAADADRADALGPPEIVAARARALLAENNGDIPGARTAFRRALTLAPDDKFSLQHLVGLDLQAPDPEAAFRNLEALKQADRGMTAASYLVRKAAIEQAAGHKDAAEQDLAQAPVDTADSLLERARIYFKLGDADRARADVDSAIRLSPSVGAWLLRAGIDGGPGSPAAAADIEAAGKLAPDNEDVLLWKVNAAIAQSDYLAALPLMKRLIAADRGATGNLVVSRGQIEAKLGRLADADADFARARAATGAEAPDLGVLCDAEVAVRWKPEAALADCERDLQRAPNSPDVLLDEVVLLHRLGREADARHALGALEAEPRSPDQLNQACYALAGEDMELERALADCDASLRSRPGDAATLDSRGLVLMRLGRDAEALEAYNAALAVRPAKHSSLYGRGLVEARMGRKDDAARDIQAALAARPALRQMFEDMGIK